jgi:hypothetical protein
MISLDCRRTSMILREDSPPKRGPPTPSLVPLELPLSPMRVFARRIRQAPLPRKGVEAISSILSALPILGPDLFGEGASRKNRIQNYCEQDYPTSCRHDREDQAASPRHRAFRPNTIGRGRCPVTQQRPLIARYSWPPMMRRRPNRATATTLGVRTAAATKLAR